SRLALQPGHADPHASRAATRAHRAAAEPVVSRRRCSATGHVRVASPVPNRQHRPLNRVEEALLESPVDATPPQRIARLYGWRSAALPLRAERRRTFADRVRRLLPGWMALQDFTPKLAGFINWHLARSPRRFSASIGASIGGSADRHFVFGFLANSKRGCRGCLQRHEGDEPLVTVNRPSRSGALPQAVEQSAEQSEQAASRWPLCGLAGREPPEAQQHPAELVARPNCLALSGLLSADSGAAAVRAQLAGPPGHVVHCALSSITSRAPGSRLRPQRRPERISRATPRHAVHRAVVDGVGQVHNAVGHVQVQPALTAAREATTQPDGIAWPARVGTCNSRSMRNCVTKQPTALPICSPELATVVKVPSSSRSFSDRANRAAVRLCRHTARCEKDRQLTKLPAMPRATRGTLSRLRRASHTLRRQGQRPSTLAQPPRVASTQPSPRRTAPSSARSPRTAPSSARSPPASARSSADRRRTGPIVSAIGRPHRPIATWSPPTASGPRSHACHGRTLRLGCRNGYKIRVLDAFYGRYSARICPKLRFKHGHRKLDSRIARCSAKNSRNEARRLCQGKRRCRLEASKKIFGKPCSSKERPTCASGTPACSGPALIVRYGRLAKHSYGYWRRKHFRHRKLRLKRKLNKLRRRFRFCFKCRRGCDKIRKLLSRIKRAEKRIHRC
uniref:SUEL-type lectin domain-containing protein n=1 Tax=Macrostomum lignano TaxID=282301 RepID=A0A1I8FI08_9PLAT